MKINYRGIPLQMDRHWNRISAIHAFIGFVSLFTPMHYISSLYISFDPNKDPQFLHFNVLVLCMKRANPNYLGLLDKKHVISVTCRS